MVDFATIARPYAQALFAASKADLQQTQQWLNFVSTIAENEQILAIVRSPNSSAKQLVKLFGDIYGTQLPTQAMNFLNVVAENGRIEALPEIARQFDVLRKSVQGVAVAQVYSAFPMNDVELSKVQLELEQRFARKLDLQLVVEPELIGGIRVVVGDEVLDTSIKARLETMKSTLIA